MRRAGDEAGFPYAMSTLCYLEVDKAGTVTQIPHRRKADRPGLEALLRRVAAGESTLYAVWPGQYQSDLFLIDDPEAFAAGLKLSAAGEEERP